MVLIPVAEPVIEQVTSRSEKVDSSLSAMTSGVQSFISPSVHRRMSDLQNKPSLPPAQLEDEFTESKVFHEHSLTTVDSNNGWVRRYKSINKSQTLSNIFLDQLSDDKPRRKKHRSPSNPFATRLPPLTVLAKY